MEHIQIAIDGPAGVGKGTIAKKLAEYYNYTYIDTGLYYRAVAYLAIKHSLTLQDQEQILKLAEEMQITYEKDDTYLNHSKVENTLRSKEVNAIVAEISCIKKVRLIINEKIKSYANGKNIVADGRDATSILFPKANVKIYLTASIEARAKRRYKQNRELYAIDESFDEVIASIQKRDHLEETKTYGGLVKTLDAHEINTTNLSIEETILKIIKIIEGE